MPTVKNLIQDAVVALLLERPAAKRTPSQWLSQLETAAPAIAARAMASKNSAKAQIVLRHIIGIERWGQQRLRVYLGEPLVKDEYDGYCSATNLSTEQQCAEFHKTRVETVEIVRKIASAGVKIESKVLHNQFGPITLGGWLRYLNLHANFESKMIR